MMETEIKSWGGKQNKVKTKKKTSKNPKILFVNNFKMFTKLANRFEN